MPLLLRHRLVRASLGALLLLWAPASAQSGHRVTIVVPDVELLETSAGDVTLTFGAPAPGEPAPEAVDASATYAVTVNTAGNKITGELDADYAERLELSVELAPPPGATGLGRVVLGPGPRDLVSDVAWTGARGLPITYRAALDGAAPGGPLRETRTVTYTLTDQ